MTRDDLLVAAGHSVAPARWAGVLDELMTRAGTRFRRAEPGRRARAFVLGLMAEHQVRRWTSWYRWATLAMLAAAALTIAAALESLRAPAPAGQIPLTRNEIAHLFASLTIKHPHDHSHRIRWSNWRRHH